MCARRCALEADFDAIERQRIEFYFDAIERQTLDFSLFLDQKLLFATE